MPIIPGMNFALNLNNRLVDAMRALATSVWKNSWNTPSYSVQAQIIVHGPCTSHQCRFYRITSTKLFAIQTILPLCIHAICANYSLKALWHLPNYVSNLCIVESWFRKVKAALDYLYIHWLNPCRTKPCVTPHVQLFEPVRSMILSAGIG